MNHQQWRPTALRFDSSPTGRKTRATRSEVLQLVTILGISGLHCDGHWEVSLPLTHGGAARPSLVIGGVLDWTRGSTPLSRSIIQHLFPCFLFILFSAIAISLTAFASNAQLLGCEAVLRSAGLGCLWGAHARFVVAPESWHYGVEGILLSA